MFSPCSVAKKGKNKKTKKIDVEMSEQNILNQVAVTIGTNLLTVGYGASIGWSSNGMVFLQSNESTLQEGLLTKDGGKMSFIRKFILK